MNTGLLWKIAVGVEDLRHLVSQFVNVSKTAGEFEGGFLWRCL